MRGHDNDDHYDDHADDNDDVDDVQGDKEKKRTFLSVGKCKHASLPAPPPPLGRKLIPNSQKEEKINAE